MGRKIYGFHAIEEALKTAPSGSILYVCRGEAGKSGRLVRLAGQTGKVAVNEISRREMDRMVPGADHRGAVLDFGGGRKTPTPLRTRTVREFCRDLPEGEGALVVILDGITDPHNLGAILRSCDQFSVSLVIVPERRSVRPNETVIKVSSGAAQYVPLAVVPNLSREMECLKDSGFWIYGADMNGTSADDTKFPPRTALVMGSEGKGLRDLVREKCDQIVSIPMSGHIDSLNVSVAAGILLYEVRRQQRSIR